MNLKEDKMDKETSSVIGCAGVIVMGLFALGAVYSASERIDAGERGVIRTWGKVDENQVLTEGLNFRMPIVQDVIRFSVRDQKLELKTEAFTKDIQNVVMDIVINYRIDSQSVAKVYKQFGDLARVEEVLIKPAILGELKNNLGKWEAVELIENRAKSSAALEESLREKLGKNFVQILDVQYKNVDFSDKFENAVEEKVTAAQNVLTERNKSAQQEEKSRQEVIRAKAEAEKVKLMAQAEADAITIQAKAEAEALRVKAEALNDKNLLLKALEQWNGELPRMIAPSGKGSSIILDVKDMIKGDAKPATKPAAKQNQTSAAPKAVSAQSQVFNFKMDTKTRQYA